MKANYFKVIILTLSMTITGGNTFATASLASPYFQDINTQQNNDEDDNNDENISSNSDENLPVIVINGTGKSTTFTINANNLQSDLPIQITTPNGFSVTPINIPSQTKNAKVTVTLNSPMKETIGKIILRSGDIRSYVKVKGIGTPLPIKDIAKSPVYHKGKDKTFEDSKFIPTNKGYTIEFKVNTNEGEAEFCPYVVDEQGYGMKGYVSSTSMGIFYSTSKKEHKNPSTKTTGGLGKFYNNDNRAHIYRYTVTPDKRVFIYRDGISIDTIRLADYGTQPDFATKNGVPQENLLKNPGFEGEYNHLEGTTIVKAVEGWNISIMDRWNSEQFIIPQEISNEQDFNNHIFRIKPYKWATGWGNGDINQIVDVAPNETYTLSALVRGGINKKEGTLTGKMIIQEVEDRSKKVEVEIGSNNWETYSLDYTTSPTCKQIRVIFQVKAAKRGASISPVDVDNVKLTGTSRTYSPKIGFENNNAEIEYLYHR